VKPVLLSLLTLSAALWCQRKIYPERWVYVSGELGTDQALQRFRDTARTASGHGSPRSCSLPASTGLTCSLRKYRQAQRAKSICERYHLDLVPSMFGTGYGGGILSHDRNLAEGLLAKDALFIVEGGLARFLARKLRFVRQRRLSKNTGAAAPPATSRASTLPSIQPSSIAAKPPYGWQASAPNRTTAPTSFNKLPSSLTASTG
jgi:hypothetical protein